MRSVVWSRRAKRSLLAILDYLDDVDPAVAHRLTQRIVDAGEALGKYPTGRPAWVPGTYLKSLTDLRYILIYRLASGPDGERVEILNVVHSMRDWVPGNLPPRPKSP